MERVYLLLRQNTESGPFTLPELKQLQLQPTDLIWIEGVSTSWNSATALTEHGDELNRAPETYSWDSPRAERGRQVTESPTLPTSFAIPEPAIRDRRTAKAHTEEEIELILHKRDGLTVSLVQLLGVACITALLTLAWDNRFKILQTQDASISYASAPTIFTPNIQTAPQKPGATASVPDSNTAIQGVSGDVSRNFSKTGKIKKSQRSLQALPKSVPSEMKALPAVDSEVLQRPGPVVEAVIPDTSTIGPEETKAEGEVAKKKTLGQALKNLFKKKGKRGKKEELEENE